MNNEQYWRKEKLITLRVKKDIARPYICAIKYQERKASG